MSYTLVETLKQMGTQIKNTFLHKADLPIKFNSTTLNNELERPFTLTEVTAQTFDPVNNELFTANKLDKFSSNNTGGTLSVNSSGILTGTINTKPGDRIFVFVSGESNGCTYTSNDSSWERVYQDNLNDNFPVAVFTKIATSDTDSVNITASYWYGINLASYISLSNVSDYSIGKIEKTNGQYMPTLFFHNKKYNSYIDGYLTGNRIRINKLVTSSSQDKVFEMIYCGDNQVQISTSRTVLGINLTFTKQDIGLSNAYAFDGTYTAVAPDATFDADTIYYTRGKVVYDQSEIATKADIDSLDLSDVSSTAGTYVYVRKCTVTVDGSGNKTPVYSWELDNGGALI